jgi:hypothetical protein
MKSVVLSEIDGNRMELKSRYKYTFSPEQQCEQVLQDCILARHHVTQPRLVRSTDFA